MSDLTEVQREDLRAIGLRLILYPDLAEWDGLQMVARKGDVHIVLPSGSRALETWNERSR